MELHCICRYISQENTQIKKSLDDFVIYKHDSLWQNIKLCLPVSTLHMYMYWFMLS